MLFKHPRPHVRFISQDGPDAGVSLRGLFIIDPNGILRQMTINDLPVGRNPEEILRLVQAFQFTGTSMLVCACVAGLYVCECAYVAGLLRCMVSYAPRVPGRNAFQQECPAWHLKTGIIPASMSIFSEQTCTHHDNLNSLNDSLSLSLSLSVYLSCLQVL
jgi:hypothetical protein